VIDPHQAAGGADIRVVETGERPWRRGEKRARTAQPVSKSAKLTPCRSMVVALVRRVQLEPLSSVRTRYPPSPTAYPAHLRNPPKSRVASQWVQAGAATRRYARVDKGTLGIL
jgi:hypothetical protein